MRSLCVHQEIRATGAQGARLLGFFYEKTRGRCRTFSVSLRLLRCSLPLRFAQPGATGPIPCLRLGRYVRFNWVPRQAISR